MRNSIVNLVVFQAFWFASILGAARGMPWLGPLLAVPWLAAHLLAARGDDRSEWQLVAAAGAVGFVLDSALVLAGLVVFPPQAALGSPSTLWMTGLWMGFATTLRGALGWLRGRYLLGGLLGAVCGPFAYWAGARLGAVMLPEPATSLVAVGIEWLVAMPLLLLADDRLTRRRANDAGSTPARAALEEASRR
ncbi:MAG: DUF2878 domain-containing protein [Gammaproteobacteria bacterium]|nr:DUF2878 domain-containing protein [Gammaproteobacteria bacterium]